MVMHVQLLALQAQQLFIIIFLAGTTGDVAAITYTGGAAPGVLLRDAINYALTANPGGIVAKVKVPSSVTVSGIVVS